VSSAAVSTRAPGVSLDGEIGSEQNWKGSQVAGNTTLRRVWESAPGQLEVELLPQPARTDPRREPGAHRARSVPGGRAESRSTFWATVFVVCTPWLIYMVWARQFHLFAENWFMSVTMVAGSFIAGSTSEGGGAVAFPVMNLGFRIAPAVARNFSLAIQSVGMSAAAVAIWRARIPIERRAVLFASLGGAAGVVLGTFFVVPLFTNPAYVTVFFASLWLSFAVALYLINRNRNRVVLLEIENFAVMRAGLVLLVVGVAGGVVTSLTGSGLDTLVFSFLCLWFGVSEKVATPTSVILMAVNSMVGFMTHLFLVATPDGGTAYWLGDFQVAARDFWLVCIPVVVIGAPAGARFIQHKSRLFVASLLYAATACQFVATLLILKPTGWLAVFTLGVFLGGSSLFLLLAASGRAEANHTRRH